jgi:hypothetical protein
VAFVLLQVLRPLHQAIGTNLGDRTAAWLYDRLTEACLRPAGMGHLEDAALSRDLTAARDFDLGMTGPPLSISMDFIAAGLVELVGGLAAAVVLARFAWWAPLLLGGAWLATHWLLRESSVWRDRATEEVRSAQRDADYAYRHRLSTRRRRRSCAVRPGRAGRSIASAAHRRRCTSCSTGRPGCGEAVVWSLAGLAANWSCSGRWPTRRRRPLDLARWWCSRRSRSAQLIAFGGLNWALDGRAPRGGVVAVKPHGPGR